VGGDRGAAGGGVRAGAARASCDELTPTDILPLHQALHPGPPTAAGEPHDRGTRTCPAKRPARIPSAAPTPPESSPGTSRRSRPSAPAGGAPTTSTPGRTCTSASTRAGSTWSRRWRSTSPASTRTGCACWTSGAGTRACSSPSPSGGRSAPGIELDEKSLERGRLRAEEHGVEVDLRSGVAEALPWDDGSFDLVILDNVLEHVRDREQTLREIRRVLRPDGLLYMVTPKPFSLYSLWNDPHYDLAGLVLMPRRMQIWYFEKVRGGGRGDVRRGGDPHPLADPQDAAGGGVRGGGAPARAVGALPPQPHRPPRGGPAGDEAEARRVLRRTPLAVRATRRCGGSGTCPSAPTSSSPGARGRCSASCTSSTTIRRTRGWPGAERCGCSSCTGTWPARWTPPSPPGATPARATRRSTACATAAWARAGRTRGAA
jgi:hypothetical protein